MNPYRQGHFFLLKPCRAPFAVTIGREGRNLI